MDYHQAFAISAAGMNVERTRVDVATLNLANAHTVAGTDGRLYQPKRVVAHSIASGIQGFEGMVANGMLSVPEASVELVSEPPKSVYEPGHPLADARGFVAYPAVDATTEMVGMMGAMRAYEANVAAMNAARTLALKALDIGG